VAPPVNPHPMTTWAKRGFRLPADRLTLLTLSSVPYSICAALVDLNLCHDMEEEFSALIANNTCDLVPRPIGSNVISDKWIFKHKFNSNDSLEWYKAHWVLRGFTQ
jgi:hypothetical protein